MDGQEKNPTNNPLGFRLGLLSLSEMEPKHNPDLKPCYLLPVTYLFSPNSPSGLLETVMKSSSSSFSKLRGHA